MAVASFDELEDEFKNDCVFLAPEVEALVKSGIDKVIGERSYDERTVRDDTNSILQTVVASLMELQKPFKYVVHCVMMPKMGGGLHTGSICHWNGEDDGQLSVRWENAHVQVITTVFGVSFFGSKVAIIDNIVGRFRRVGNRLIPLSKSKHATSQAQQTY